AGRDRFVTAAQADFDLGARVQLVHDLAERALVVMVIALVDRTGEGVVAGGVDVDTGRFLATPLEAGITLVRRAATRPIVAVAALGAAAGVRRRVGAAGAGPRASNPDAGPQSRIAPAGAVPTTHLGRGGVGRAAGARAPAEAARSLGAVAAAGSDPGGRRAGP